MKLAQPSIGGSLFQAYTICPRQAWLMSRNLSGDQFNEFLEIGRFLADQTYKRERKEIRFGDSVFDMMKSDDGQWIVIETKKTSRSFKAAENQLLFYLYTLRKNIPNCRGEIRIPKEKKIVHVVLDEEKMKHIQSMEEEIKRCIAEQEPPHVERISYCKTCSHLEFCWA